MESHRVQGNSQEKSQMHRVLHWYQRIPSTLPDERLLFSLQLLLCLVFVACGLKFLLDDIAEIHKVVQSLLKSLIYSCALCKQSAR